MSEKKQLRPSGLWPSLITPEMTGKLLEFSELIWNGNGCLYWKERTSDQTGIYRYCQDQDNTEDLTPEINVGGGVGYGGGSFTVKGNSVLFVEKGSNPMSSGVHIESRISLLAIDFNRISFIELSTVMIIKKHSILY